MSLFFSATGRQPKDQQQRSTWVWPNYRVMSGSYADIDANATAETSLHSVAFHAAVDLVCSLGSELPMHVFSGGKTDRKLRPTPSYLDDPAGDGYGRQDWAYQVLLSWLIRGNLYGDILQKSPLGFPTQIMLHHPDSVSGSLNSSGGVDWVVDGRPVKDPANFLHRRVFPVPGRVQGLSPVTFHASTLGLSLTSMQFGLQWFRDGAHPSGILTNSEVEINGEQAKTIKERFMEALHGTREPVVMGRGWKFDRIQLNPEESQFLKTQGFTAAEACRIVGPGIAEILGYESGGAMTYSNIESRAAHVLVFAANKWFRRLERLLSGMLPQSQYVLIDRDALLQTTTLERYKAHALALANKWKVVNEVREDEDMPPVPWGNEPVEASTPAQPDDMAGGGDAGRASRHLPGKHDQSTHGRKYKAGTDLIGSGNGAAVAHDVDEEAAGKAFASKDGTGRQGPDGDQQLVAIAGKQGFDGKPRSVSKSDMDTLVTEKGHLELHRGVVGREADGGPSAAQINAKYRGGDYYGGSGHFGNGTYVGPNKQRSEDFYSDGTKGSMLRMAARPEAKIVSQRDLLNQHETYLAKQPKGSAQHSVFSDPGRFAAAKGYDIIHVPRGGFSDEYIVLNRTSVIVQKA